jgi:hypothetical protein
MFYVLSRLVRTLRLILLHAHYPLLKHPKLCDLPPAIRTIFLEAGQQPSLTILQAKNIIEFKGLMIRII